MCLDDLVIIAKVSHPIPFRTRPLNPLALMVLRLKARESKSSPDLPNISVSLVYVCYMCCTHCSAMGVPFYYMLYSHPTVYLGYIFPFRTQHSCIASSITGILYHYRKKFSQRFDVVHFAKTWISSQSLDILGVIGNVQSFRCTNFSIIESEKTVFSF